MPCACADGGGKGVGAGSYDAAMITDAAPPAPPALAPAPAHAEPEATGVLAELMALETAAIDRWGAGDPDGFLAISADDVTYFDPWQATRIDGLPALTALYEGLRGHVRIDEYAFVEPVVCVAGDMAVLTFRFESTGGEGVMRWNTTEVYRRSDADAGPAWCIVHSHWSLTEAGAQLASAGVL